MEKAKAICRLVEEKAGRFTAVSDAVWDTPELGFEVERSAAVIIKALEREGFQVEGGLAGIATAFKGTWGENGPVIAFLGEYDALPNLSQAAGVAERQELVPGGDGHGCGHNALGAGALAAAVALRDYIRAKGLPGRVVYFGCPGEEFGCGKAFMARAGCFANLDCAFSWHPQSYTGVWNYGSLAHLSLLFDFKGVAAHASSEPYNGRSALDAAELMNVGANFLREHIPPAARLHYAFHDAGGMAPNVVQDRARLNYYVRAPKIAQTREILERVKKVAAGAAMMTETDWSFSITDGLSDFIPNSVATTVLAEAMNELGPIAYAAADYALAEKFRAAVSEAAYNTVLEQMHSIGGSLAEEYRGKNLMDGILPCSGGAHIFPASTDVGDVSYCVPTAQLMAAVGCLGTALHTWQMTAQGRTSLAHKGLLFAGKSMALAGLKLLERPELLKEAKREWLSATGGKYVCPFPDEVMPEL
ncbi:MAG: amidohydrolase [Deltaproteobacteria bacterium]|jgi:aminobenzoyl-glutamate utilization protein B|nr:amidohydrolase [Deltaproteobacteria bacterium]